MVPWITSRRSDYGSVPKIDQQLSEIDGGDLINRTSVYLHLEQGLAKSPNDSAIISLQQSPDELRDLEAVSLKFHSTGSATTKDVLTQSDTDPKRFDGRRKGFRFSAKMLAQETRKLSLVSRRMKPSRTEINGSDECLKLSYLQLHHMSQTIAAGLLANGVEPQSNTLMLIPNGAEYGLLLWTSVLMRTTFTCADPDVLRASETDQLREIIRTLKPSLIVAADRQTADDVDSLVHDLNLAQPLRVCLEMESASKSWKSMIDVGRYASGCPIDMDDLLEDARNDDPNRVYWILFTSGTSGKPKGCPLRVRGMTHMLHSQSWLVEKETSYRALQQAHPSRGICPAQTVQTWRAGGAVVMTNQGFSVDDMVPAIRDYKATFIVLTPSMVHEFGQEVATRPFDVSSVRQIQIGGDAVTKDVLTRCATIFPRARICINHGMTEGGGSFSWPFLETPVSSIPFFGEMCPLGTVAAGSIVRVWDADNNQLAKRGDPGELHICCASIIRHYLGGASDDSFYEDDTGRWFNTGDVGIMNDDGLVFILGRSKDRIRHADTVIMPAPVESCLDKYTGMAVSTVEIHLAPLESLQVFRGHDTNWCLVKRRPCATRNTRPTTVRRIKRLWGQKTGADPAAC